MLTYDADFSGPPDWARKKRARKIKLRVKFIYLFISSSFLVDKDKVKISV